MKILTSLSVMSARALLYANPASKNNFILRFFYILAYPLAVLLGNAKIRPNFITTFSLTLTVISIVFLFLGEKVTFITLWFFSHYLDFVDGTLARLTKKERLSEFKYDHYSDIARLVMTFFAVGIHYDQTFFWALTFSVTSIFLIFTILNHDNGSVTRLINHKAHQKALSATNVTTGEMQGAHSRSTQSSPSNPLPLKLQIRQVLLTINGHTLFLFPFAVISYEYAVILYTYFGFLSSYQAWQAALRLKKIKRLH